jgi:site-specific DNA recombinase
MGLHAVCYARVSTVGQATEGVSLEAQQEAVARWCASNDAALDLADVFVDSGISGKRADNRPALQAALDRVCGSGGALIVYSLSRLARSVRDTLTIAERLDRAGADLVSLSERIDTTSAAGKMMFRLLAVLAEFERDLISERTSGALAHIRSKGELAGTLPFGKRLDVDGKTLLDDSVELEALASMRRWRAGGMSWRAIANRLTEEGIRPKRGGPTWSFGSVKDLLEPRKGRHAKGRKAAGGDHPPA